MHQKLESGYQFSNWIQNRIKEYGLIENEDFFAKEKTLAKGKGGHNRIDYLLSLDTAKEIAMLERNEIGRMIRRYFIQKEKEARGEYYVLPRERVEQVLHGIKSSVINQRKMYPFKKAMTAMGKKPGGSLYYYTKRYANHFVNLEGVWYVSEELAFQIYHSRLVTLARRVNTKMQPVLPFNFADSKELQEGGHHESI